MTDRNTTGSAVDALLDLPPYGLSPQAKNEALARAVGEELVHHYEHCEPYRTWCRKRGFDPREGVGDLAGVPFLPVGIFKRMLLRSAPEDQVVRVLASSATTSQTPSRIPLDRVTRNRQMRALLAILVHLLGGQRRPFVVLDAAPSTTAGAADRELSARVAGMRGYLMASSETEYVFQKGDAGPALDVDRLIEVVGRLKSAGGPFCLLGYTYILYQYVVAPLRAKGVRLELPDGAMILHFGGWKRLRDQAVDRSVLLAHTAEVFGVEPGAIRDVYGFTEQLGVIYPDGPDGLKRVPTYSEVFVRDPRTFERAPDGQIGLLEFVCPLPHSYPGVAVLLDDLGRVLPSPDGQGGTVLEITGRTPRAEARGCGDTLPARTYESA